MRRDICACGSAIAFSLGISKLVVVGSNVFNIALCLGLAGLVAPNGLEAPTQLLAFDLRVMVMVAVVLLPLIFTDVFLVATVVIALRGPKSRFRR